MRTVREMSRLTGVSVRTLHHYDAIGLLKPSQISPAGYRLYDSDALARLQSILLFRELRFPLKEIKAMLDKPDFDPQEALEQQIKLLELQAAHLQTLIRFAREVQRKGVEQMDFHAFNREELDRYTQEVRERWGATQAYAEFAEKSRGLSQGQREEAVAQLLSRFARLGALRDQHSPADPAVQEALSDLQAFITEHYYHCTNEILQGLGKMYVCDDRMKHTIDQAGGDGTAEFVHSAIEAYCAER